METKDLKERIAREVWGTDPENFIAESQAGTPYETDSDTLDDIADVCMKIYEPEIAKLKKSLEYNAMLSVRFMIALVNISQSTTKLPLNEIYLTHQDCIEVAKEALKTPSFETFTVES